MSPATLMSKDLFEKAFRSFFQDSTLQIMGFSSKAAVGVGENYTSNLFRAAVSYCRNNNDKKETKSVIVKLEMRDNPMEALTKEMQLFNKEIEMFSKILPLMYEALGDFISGNCLGANCLYTSTDPHALLVLEDLKENGFVMAPRQLGLDYEHCQSVIKKIAMFHAASVIVVDKDPALIKKYTAGIYSGEELLPWMSKGLHSLAEACLESPDLAKYGVKLQKLEPTLVKSTAAAIRRKPGVFNVMNHGDLWINNILFKYQPNGKLDDLTLVDFQIVYYSSPALDLHYFITTSANEDVRENYVEVLLDSYYGHFLAFLASMKYSLSSVPSREEFRKDYNSRAFYGVLAASTVLPIVRASRRDDATFEDLMKDETTGSFRHHCYTNESYMKAIRKVLPYLDSLGGLD